MKFQNIPEIVQGNLLTLFQSNHSKACFGPSTQCRCLPGANITEGQDVAPAPNLCSIFSYWLTVVSSNLSLQRKLYERTGSQAAAMVHRSKSGVFIL